MTISQVNAEAYGARLGPFACCPRTAQADNLLACLESLRNL